MFAAKWLDPVIGVDIHVVLVPAPPSPVPIPTPLPHPFIGFVFDPMGLAMGIAIGAVVGAISGGGGAGIVLANGLPVGNTGTNVQGIPHFPMPPGIAFAPFDIPDNDGTLITGSQTVHAAGTSWSRTGSIVMSCSFPIPLPTSVCLAVPMGPPVLIGGPEGVDALAALMAVGAGLLKNVVRTKWFSDFLHSKLRIKPNSRLSAAVCFLTGHPVDVMTGEVLTSQVDFSLPGPIPLSFERNYYSRSRYVGPLGQGWHHPLDTAVCEGEHRLTVRLPDGRECYEVPLAVGDFIWNDIERYTLSRHRDGYRLTTWDGLSYFYERIVGISERHPLARIVDRCGNIVRLSYQDGLLREVLDSAGRNLRWLWNSARRLESIALIDHAANTVQHLVRYEYNRDGFLRAAIDPLGHAYRFEYRGGVLVKETNRNGLSFHFEYEWHDPDGWCTRTWGDGGIYDHVLTYDKLRHVTLVEDSRGGRTVYQGNARGLVVERRDASGGVWKYEWDDACRKTAEVDPAGHRSEYRFDERGNQIKVIRPDDIIIEQAYDENNRATRLRDGNGQVWRRTFDDRGLLIEQGSPLGATRRYAYDGRGNLIKYTDELGGITRVERDERGQVRSIVDALGHATHYEIDKLGNLLSEEDPLGRCSRYQYDRCSRLVAVRKPGGGEIRCTYDGEGNLVEYHDEEGRRTRLEYCGYNEVARRLQPDGASVRYLYDREEHLIGLTNQRGETYHLKRDPVGRIIEEIDYWGQARKYAYDPAGNLLRSQDALGRVIKYKTDAAGRLIEKALPDGTVEHFSYDGNGNLIATKNQHCAVRRLYDSDGRLAEEHQNDFVLKNTYDRAGNRISRHSSHGNTVDYSYDGLGRVTTIQINSGAPMRIERDAAGQAISETLSPELTRHYRYTPDGQIATQSVRTHDQEIIHRQYAYDRSGELVRRSDARWGTDQFHYDPMGRVREHVDPTGKVKRYLHDPHGDLLQKVRQSEGTGPGWERVCEYEGTTYRFDAVGNLVERKDLGGSLQLDWDANNRLVQSRRGDGPVTTYGYDAQGRRVFKQTQEYRTLFYWDRDFLLSDSPNDDSNEFVYYPETFRPVAVTNNQLQLIFDNDINGQVSDLIDQSGKIHWSRNFSLASTRASFNDHIFDNRIGMQGQYIDTETGLMYNRHRYFDDNAIIYVSQDPLGLLGGINTFAYAPNPLTWADPYGLTKGKHKPDSVKDVAVFDDWDIFLGKGEKTDINPIVGHKNFGQKDMDRIFAVQRDGSVRAVRFGDHEMAKPAGKGMHYHREQWDSQGKFLDQQEEKVNVLNTKKPNKGCS